MLDANLIAFVRNSLRTIWALEVLLVIRRRAPGSITLAEIDRELRATPYLVRRIVHQLVEEGLVAIEEPDRVKFQAGTTELAQLCELLDSASRDRPIALRDAIIARPDDKLRNFANAFKITQKDKDEDKDK